ncbi:F0F1 ATP synthase subunit delta [Bacillus horti]|uniref:ATP synthase subunit delta n=1 Tax=Caldalkalibacillus horti TaxID=77523 RepID=A0ABT9VZQ3_9BACI|nr:F0F1 ATP synthase subunit delta [Bacillus horti]MDQ0166466.1 F-type H+-transporting ATPase subunit delta [Bacillus horti]
MSAVGRRYAKALYELARDKNQLDTIEEELQKIEQVFAENPLFLKFLHSPQIARETKIEQLTTIFKDQISATMLQFITLLIERNREDEIESVFEYYVYFANRERGLADAYVTSTKPLTDDEKQGLVDHFSKKLNKKIRITNHVDSSILGGVIVKIGDSLYDGSVSGKLHRFKRRVVTSKS